MLAQKFEMKGFYFLLFLANLKMVFSCLCMPSHPQEQLCHNNTFVVLIKVRSEEYVYADQENNFVQPKSDDEKLDLLKNRVINRSADLKRKKQVTFRPRPKQQDVVVDNLNQLPFDAYITSRIRYQVKVYEAYKGVDKAQLQGKTVYLYTAPDEGLCGRKLHEKKTYIVMGHINEEQQLSVGLCDHVIEWDNLDIKQKRNVRRNMRDSATACRSKCEVRMCRLWDDCRQWKPNTCMWSMEMEKKTQKMGKDATNYLCMPASKYGGKDDVCMWSRPVMDKKRRRRRRHHEFSLNKKQVHSP